MVFENQGKKTNSDSQSSEYDVVSRILFLDMKLVPALNGDIARAAYQKKSEGGK